MLIAITAVLALGQNDTAKEPFTVVINVETPIVKVGSGVSVNGRLTNISNQPLDTSGCYCGPSGQREFTRTQNLQPAAQFWNAL